MSKLIIALIAGAFATVAGAQNMAAPSKADANKAKQEAAAATTTAGSQSAQGTANQAENVAKSKAMGAAHPADKKVSKDDAAKMQKASTP